MAEAAVIGKPDPTSARSSKPCHPQGRFRRRRRPAPQLLGHARKRLGAAVAPKEIQFVDALPHTSSGKIMRRLLKAPNSGYPKAIRRPWRT
ncbi:hypothetical protein BZL29_8531 [Mycobacterium kansasii]|uniref:AMP-binding enzyme C-terminal domain-containing protein n=1 Tax=Mycobacterium kansasii TaxID=1768 RepID=A0A1V3W8Q0_MYCKA|nr:hypothetical protein BZL29_8531 [Mycobacterium kansasii]